MRTWKESFKGMLKVTGVSLLNVVGYSLLIGGVMEELWWLAGIGFMIIDLSPSFVKAVWKDASLNFEDRQ